MGIRNGMLFATILSLGLGVVAACAADDQIKSPTEVPRALGTLTGVVDHTGRLIAAKNYGVLPSEDNEFKQGAQALNDTLAGAPGDLRARVDPLLAKANAEAENIAKAAASHDDSKLAASHAAALASSVQEIGPGNPCVFPGERPTITAESGGGRT